MNRRSAPNPAEFSDAVDASMPIAERLFSELEEKTADGVGVTRGSYGEGEQIAHDLLEEAATSLDLEIDKDPAGNLYMTLPGENREAPAWFVGSHLDSVYHGGNYDGAAGVIAGVTAQAALQRLGVTPKRDITVMGIRAEECSTWFVGHHGGHLGSRAVLGLLWPGEMESAIHVHTGRTLAQCMDEAGFDSSYFRESSRPYLGPDNVKGVLRAAYRARSGPSLQRIPGWHRHGNTGLPSGPQRPHDRFLHALGRRAAGDAAGCCVGDGGTRPRPRTAMR